MKKVVEINNLDNSIIRELKVDDNWVAPSHKYGPDKSTKFLELVNEPTPVFDNLIFNSTPKNKIEDNKYIKYFETERKSKIQIIDIIKNLATQKINEQLSSEDKLNMLAAAIEFEKNHRTKKVSTQEEIDLDIQRQKYWDWVKEIRVFAKNLIINVDNLDGLKDVVWPELSK